MTSSLSYAWLEYPQTRRRFRACFWRKLLNNQNFGGCSDTVHKNCGFFHKNYLIVKNVLQIYLEFQEFLHGFTNRRWHQFVLNKTLLVTLILCNSYGTVMARYTKKYTTCIVLVWQARGPGQAGLFLGLTRTGCAGPFFGPARSGWPGPAVLLGQ